MANEDNGAPFVAFSYWYQSLTTQSAAHPANDDDILWPPSTLDLLSNSMVSYGDGPVHGDWVKSDSELQVCFHWQGDPRSSRMHVFKYIADTSVLVLVHVDGRIRTDAILVPRSEPSNGRSTKRPRSDCSRPFLMVCDR